MKFFKNHLNLILGIILGILGLFLVFILQFKIIGDSFSAFFILIGAGLTAIMNDYINKKTEERNEIKKEIEEKRKHDKISKIISNILLNNYGVSKGNIHRIKENPTNIHLHLLKTGFLDLAIRNVSPDEDFGENYIIEIMKISLNVDTINSDIQRREEFIKTRIMEKECLTYEFAEPEVDKINQRLIKNSEGLMELISNYDKLYIQDRNIKE
ncbi:hypothetical protein [Methanobacterium formicicum]|uniref:Uncharacterized protein n=1 Tax=Methanobacterium formicicum TaxID=2162 RepID=A0A0S4FN38_METFO|nr:hypothetical protein [Methanobacterium formicicum]CEL24434.1 hypothetical protein MB9_0791 [Methanobacterium formicicum]